MRKSGATNNVNQKAAKIIHFGGLIVPLLLTFYGVLIEIGAITPQLYAGRWALVAICLSWILLGVYQLLGVSRSPIVSVAKIIAYHVLGAAYIFLISGFATPFVSTWIILFLAAYAYFGKNGFSISAMALVIVAFLDSALYVDNISHSLTNLLYLLSTLSIGYIAVLISQSQEIDKKELFKSRAERTLQHDRIMTIVNNLADAVIATDKDGNIELYNAATLSLFDTNVGLEGKNINDIAKFFDCDKKTVNPAESLKQSKGVVSRSDISTTVADEVVRLSVIYSRVRGNDSTRQSTKDDGYVVIMRDITKEKSLEEERDEFISVVSHELRTPITIAEGTLGNTAIMIGRGDIPKDKIESNVKMAHDQVVFLAKMVNDLSTLSRAERGIADTVELIDVKALANKIYNEYSKQATVKGVALNLELDNHLESVEASRLYLEELLQNFVTNAIKYTKEGHINFVVRHTPNDMIEFLVKDTGIGISKADQAKIFEKFYRSEDYRTRETGGTGLGLYVATKLARKLGTHIKMTSRLNHGSTFSIELPKASIHRS